MYLSDDWFLYKSFASFYNIVKGLITVSSIIVIPSSRLWTSQNNKKWCRWSLSYFVSLPNHDFTAGWERLLGEDFYVDCVSKRVIASFSWLILALWMLLSTMFPWLSASNAGLDWAWLTGRGLARLDSSPASNVVSWLMGGFAVAMLRILNSYFHLNHVKYFWCYGIIYIQIFSS